MSITTVTATAKNARSATVANRATSASGTTWTRPADWLALPNVQNQQLFAGLFAIYPDANFVALSAAGNYTVDWGDGTVQNFTSGAVAERQYSYASISNTGESNLGYRQVVIQVYPQGGQNLTSVNINRRHSQSGLNTGYRPPWLEVAVNGSNLTTLTIGGAVPLSLLTKATIYNHALTSCNSLFQNCSGLVSVPLFNTAAVTNMNSMFQNCSSLSSVPAWNVGAVTSANFGSIFTNCNSLARCQMANINQTISFASCKLSADEINAIFTALSATGTGKTITVTGNYGAATCTPSIATSKGWTVVI